RVGIDFNQNVTAGCRLKNAAWHQPDPCYGLALQARWQPQRAMLLSDKQVHTLVAGLKGDSNTSLLAAPKMTTFEGPEGCVRNGEARNFVTDVKETEINGQVVWAPVQTTEFIGTDLALQGSLTADGKQVCVHVRGSLSTLDPTVPLEPRTTEIAPVFEGGAQGVPVPFTQFIQ